MFKLWQSNIYRFGGCLSYYDKHHTSILYNLSILLTSYQKIFKVVWLLKLYFNCVQDAILHNFSTSIHKLLKKFFFDISKFMRDFRLYRWKYLSFSEYGDYFLHFGKNNYISWRSTGKIQSYRTLGLPTNLCSGVKMHIGLQTLFLYGAVRRYQVKIWQPHLCSKWLLHSLKNTKLLIISELRASAISRAYFEQLSKQRVEEP